LATTPTLNPMKERLPEQENPFGFTERERLYDRIGDKRFQALLTDEQTSIHEVQLSTNSFGEFLFVTLSRPSGQSREGATFYSLGFHEYRERWIADVWSWYKTSRNLSEATFSKEEAMQLISERRAEVASHLTEPHQSERAKLYEILAGLSDEDGALTEIEDLSDFFDFDDE
jgi:hypothetical protein